MSSAIHLRRPPDGELNSDDPQRTDEERLHLYQELYGISEVEARPGSHRQHRKVGAFVERYHHEWNIDDVAEDCERRIAEITTMR